MKTFVTFVLMLIFSLRILIVSPELKHFIGLNNLWLHCVHRNTGDYVSGFVSNVTSLTRGCSVCASLISVNQWLYGCLVVLTDTRAEIIWGNSNHLWRLYQSWRREGRPHLWGLVKHWQGQGRVGRSKYCCIEDAVLRFSAIVLSCLVCWMRLIKEHICLHALLICMLHAACCMCGVYRLKGMFIIFLCVIANCQNVRNCT